MNKVFYFLFPTWYNFLIIEEFTGNLPSINAYNLLREDFKTKNKKL